MDMKRIVVKVGSSVLTGANGLLNKRVVSDLVNDVVDLTKEKVEVVLISSGAVNLGKSSIDIGKFKIDVGEVKYSKNVLEEQILASIGQPKLMAFYIQEFEKDDIICSQVLATRSDFASREKYLSLKAVTTNLLRIGVIPIFNENDAVSHEELDFSDNDQLAYMVAAMISADCLILITDVPGFLDGQPGDPKAKVVKVIEDINIYIKKVHRSFGKGKGGMESKLRTADMITSLGIPMYICGFGRGIIMNIVKGGAVGTYFPSSKKKIKGKKSWIATSALSRGTIILSNYIADLLRERKAASVLFAGVEGIIGNFSAKEVINLCDESGKILAKGMVRFGSKNLRSKIKEFVAMEDSEKGKLDSRHIIAVHYDEMVFCGKS
jgi:glutamate 5-kinase